MGSGHFTSRSEAAAAGGRNRALQLASSDCGVPVRPSGRMGGLGVGTACGPRGKCRVVCELGSGSTAHRVYFSMQSTLLMLSTPLPHPPLFSGLITSEYAIQARGRPRICEVQSLHSRFRVCVRERDPERERERETEHCEGSRRCRRPQHVMSERASETARARERERERIGED